MNGSRTSSGQFKLTTKTAAIVGVSALGVAGLLGVTIWITAHISGGGSGTGAGSGGGGKAPGAAPAAKNVNPPAPLDDAAREARQRALAQIPESSGTVAPVEALRRVPISLPPPAAAGGRVTAPPTPVKLDVPSGTPVTPARPGTPATPANPGGGVRPPPPPTPGGAALPANDPNAPLPLELALHPSLYTDVNKVAARLAPVTLGGTSATVSATPTTADPQEKLRLEAIRLEKARQFVMSMCLDQQGRIWVGCENTQPGDGTGGIQVFTPGAPRFQEWKQYTVKDGLGDDNGYAVACDLQGRIWAGHLNHGVSVFNGEKWQTYEVVGGLSRPDTLNGPLGERIFHITVCPATATGKFKDSLTNKESTVAGSVWMCSNAGLSIYFPSTDTWSYLTRADGLPSDQANSLAFAKDGTVYVATQCDGIAIASANDGYKSWKHVARWQGDAADSPLSDELPVTPTGTGLPTNLMNDILVAKDGTVYATTTAGVVWSLDKGERWQFMRGADWADKVKGRLGGAPAGWVAREGAMLSEDYSTALAEDERGNILVGHRANKTDVLTAFAVQIIGSVTSEYTTSIQHLRMSYQGTYGNGINIDSKSTVSVAPSKAIDSQISTIMPAGHLVRETYLDALAKRFADKAATSDPANVVTLLNPDWSTQGAWLGRYGRFWMVHAACISPIDFYWGTGAVHVEYNAQQGPGVTKGDSLRYWISTNHTSDPRSLELCKPYLQSRVERQLCTWEIDRRQSEWDDHGEAYPMTKQGPGLFLTVTVPPGDFILSIYNINENGHRDRNRFRDYGVSIRENPGIITDVTHFKEWPELARGRIVDYYGGVYTKMLIRGPRQLTIYEDRNYSINSNMAGAFLDSVEEYPRPYYNTRPLTDAVTPVGRIFAEFEKLRSSNLTSYTNLSGVVYGTLARQGRAALSISESKDYQASRQIFSSICFRRGFFATWEQVQCEMGIQTARQIENSLRWDGKRSNLYPGMNADLVSEYLKSQVSVLERVRL